MNEPYIYICADDRVGKYQLSFLIRTTYLRVLKYDGSICTVKTD